MNLITSPSQTVGPFFHIGFDRLYVNDLTAKGVSGERVIISGKIIDGDGKPITDAVIEIWQADAQGQYSNSADAKFKGYGRIPTDEHGRYNFVTLKPGRVAGTEGELQAPHIAVSIFMRGLLKRLVTRIYFPDEASNNEDTILKLTPSERRATLMANKLASDATKLEWNIVVQGKQETVFFDC
jgi:protocatechuate 3,4-dioxygenase alpha subunit